MSWLSGHASDMGVVMEIDEQVLAAKFEMILPHLTAQFAVETIRRWWTTVGHAAYPDTSTLLVTADAGGSNGYRLRLWKKELAAFADESGLTITVCHMPPGTSKWNRIEVRHEALPYRVGVEGPCRRPVAAGR